MRLCSMQATPVSHHHQLEAVVWEGKVGFISVASLSHAREIATATQRRVHPLMRSLLVCSNRDRESKGPLLLLLLYSDWAESYLLVNLRWYYRVTFGLLTALHPLLPLSKSKGTKEPDLLILLNATGSIYKLDGCTSYIWRIRIR